MFADSYNFNVYNEDSLQSHPFYSTILYLTWVRCKKTLGSIFFSPVSSFVSFLLSSSESLTTLSLPLKMSSSSVSIT